jgi:hypothetical protein
VEVHRTVPRLNRRGFLTASAATAAGLGASGLAASVSTAAGASSGSPGQSDLTEAVLAGGRLGRGAHP